MQTPTQISEKIQKQIRFARFTQEHIPLFLNWLSQEHVSRFWKESSDVNEIEKKFCTNLPERGFKPFVIEFAGYPIGYIQYYEAYRAGGGWWENEKPGTFGVDIMIGEKSYIGRGWGVITIQKFIELLCKQESRVKSIIIDPDPNNFPAISAFKKAGFNAEKEILTPNGRALLMRRPVTTSS